MRPWLMLLPRSPDGAEPTRKEFQTDALPGIECSERQIRRWFTERALPVFKSPINGRLLIKKDRLLAFLENAADEQASGTT